MSDSGRQINYQTRPAKCVERKILCELLEKFNTPIPIHNYRYIGFGSFYFSDFVLFHNTLHMNNMISIEKSENKDRYLFNNPYKCISLLFCDAEEALLKTIDFSETSTKDFIWLDYDANFQESMVRDIINASHRVNSGSFIFLTFNPSIPKDEEENRLPFLRANFEEYLPKISEKDITSESIPRIIYSIVDSAVQKAIYTRNIIESDPISAHSIFFIKYKDGAVMLTVGYYYANEKDWDLVKDHLQEIPWTTTAGVPRSLTIPNLTRSEIRELNKCLPGDAAESIHSRVPFLSISDIEKYSEVYKYYPNFSDSPFYT